jgi:glycosyltransferase involved in cell wall biosynthesis
MVSHANCWLPPLSIRLMFQKWHVSHRLHARLEAQCCCILPPYCLALQREADHMKNILIEGWRTVNHSYALVNQYQILELLKHEDLCLFHRDLPYASARWDAKTVGSGFAEEDRERIDALAEPAEGASIDFCYRIASPFQVSRSVSDTCKKITFMVTEVGLSATSFPDGTDVLGQFTENDDLIVTPSNWSKERIVEFGFDATKIMVVPHGVDQKTFHPVTSEEKSANRRNLGIKDDDVVFLNLGAVFWNKGVDILLLAFAKLRQRHKNLRLILKDQRALYGKSIDQTVHDLCAKYPSLFTADTLDALILIGVNLSQEQLRLMYGIADCYVSPYRAEGFNLPVLEALACGIPVVVTEGGATDDFCSPEVAVRLPSTAGLLDQLESGCIARYREPDPDAIVEVLERFITGRGIDADRFGLARKELLDRMSWKAAVDMLQKLM